MIEPSNGQRGVIGEGHGLARLTSTLDALSQGQAQQRTRDTHLQEQLATLTQDMRMMMCWGKRLVGALGVLAVLTLALCGVGGWQMTHRPDMGYARALGTLDATLAQTWGSMPKTLQEQLNATYSRVGLVPPGQRK